MKPNAMMLVDDLVETDGDYKNAASELIKTLGAPCTVAAGHMHMRMRAHQCDKAVQAHAYR